MRAVVLATDPHDGNARGWCAQLQRRGIDSRLLFAEAETVPAADLVIAHLLLAAGRAPHPMWTVARAYEQSGVPLLNSTAAIALSAHKGHTYRAWSRAGLPQPRTWSLDGLSQWPGGLLLLKPALGESSRGISVEGDLAGARERAQGWAHEALVQEAVPCRSVLRVHATQQLVLGAFARPATVLAGLPAPDPVERAVPVGPKLHELATAAVRALGGGLLGLDLIEHDGRLLLLEANATFALPTHLPQLLDAVIDQATRLCATPGETIP